MRHVCASALRPMRRWLERQDTAAADQLHLLQASALAIFSKCQNTVVAICHSVKPKQTSGWTVKEQEQEMFKR